MHFIETYILREKGKTEISNQLLSVKLRSDFGGFQERNTMKCTQMLQNSDPSRRKFSGKDYIWEKAVYNRGVKKNGLNNSAGKGVCAAKRHMRCLGRHAKSIVLGFLLMSFLFLLDSLVFSLFDSSILKYTRKSYAPKVKNRLVDEQEPVVMYSRLLHMASVSLAERELEQKESKYWTEPYPLASTWKPCADINAKRAGKLKKHNSFILVSANGGLNQQRVAVCNAVAVASLLNATLVIPKFLYSNVWKDPSQFSDIYQEKTFMSTLKDDIDIIKNLPSHLKSIDFEAIGSLVTDADLPKEATPNEYIKNILPILLRNEVVHFLGFGNRLGFDPLPSELKKLRCKCNFHALKFVPKIQKMGSVLVKRIRKYDGVKNMLDEQLVGNFISKYPLKKHTNVARSFKYLALHMRFEVDMVAYSMCNFGGGENETSVLRAYRREHFPLVLGRLKKIKPISPTKLRIMGKCPLTPEEAALMLAGLGFDSTTYIYLAGSEIYGGKSRMQPFTSLYPNIVTKENLLSPSEISPFRNFSSQLAALDFIVCAASDVFTVTDSGSQLSSLVSGYRIYYGGNGPTLRPNKKRLAAIFQENSTIRWHSFESRIRKMIEEGQRVRTRSFGISIYRQPRCRECMCRHNL